MSEASNPCLENLLTELKFMIFYQMVQSKSLRNLVRASLVFVEDYVLARIENSTDLASKN